MEQIKLNTIPSGVPSVCHISQFDNTSRIIRCHLFNGADPLTLTGSETIRLFVRKSNNSRAEFEIESASGSFIDLTITSEMSDIAGDSECKFQITDSEKTIGTLNFKMIVEPDAYGDSLKTRSVSGPIATFETDLAEDLIKLDADLEPVQDLHGYDNPWPAGGGDNVMLPSPNNKSGTVNGITYSYDAETGKITLSGTNNNTSAHGLVGFKPLEDGLITPNFQVGETYTLSVYLPQNTMYCQFTYKDTNNTTRAMAYKRGTGSFSSITFTIPDNFVELIQFIIYVDGTATALSGEIYFELVKGSTSPTSYSPYSNICPISGHDSAQLLRTGKNLAPKENSLTSLFTMDSDGVFTQNNPESAGFSWIYSNSIIRTILPAGSYTLTVFAKEISTKQPSNACICNDSDELLANIGTMRDKTLASVSFTLNATTKIGVIAKIYDGAFYFQIENGSTATDYEPYESDPTPITVQFGQTVYKGKLYSEQRKVLVTSVLVDLGNLTWGHSISDTRNFFYTTRAFDVEPKGVAQGSTNDDISSEYRCAQYSEVVNGSVSSSFNIPNTTKRLYLYDASKTGMTAEEFTAAVTGVQLVYEIEEPFFIDLTQVQTASIDSTPVASFETTLAMPLNTSEHSFSCSQAEGTPTPDSPIPITGVSEITAFRTGKNLLDKNSYEFANSGNIIWGGAVGGYADGSFILPSGTYTLSSPVSCAGLYISDNEKSIKIVYNKTSITFTLDKTTPIRMMLYINGVTKDDILSYNYQLELNSTATSYEPYSGESITVSLGGTYYGGKLVQSEDGSRKIVLSHKKLTFNGTENWQSYPAQNGFYIALESAISDTVNDTISDKFVSVNSYSLYGIRVPAGGERYYFCKITDNISAVTDLASWKTWLSNNNVTVVSKLATPIEVSLPDGDPLNAVVGENNVYCNTGNTALTYYFNMVADPIRIPALVGTNNVYSDAGDVDVEYYTTLEGGND